MKAKRYIAITLAVFMTVAILSSCKKDAEPAAPEKAEVVYYMVCEYENTLWDPALTMSISDASLAPMIYENLFELKLDGSIGPQLAERWEVSPDGLKYTFHLRHGVQWHKGYGEFTSADVKFTLERQSDPALGSVHADDLQVDNIASIECPDDYTVILNLKQVDVDLLNRLAEYYGVLVCKAHYDKNGHEGINTDPIGTGSFAFDSGTLMMRTEAVRNHEWWGSFTGNIDRVVSTYITDTNTMYAAFDGGELDGITLYDIDKMLEYESKGYEIGTVPMRQLLYISLNMQLEPFDDPMVRQAFFHAIDVDYYLQYLFQGTESAVGSYLPPNSKYAVRDYFSNEYNPDKAKQLLSDAGYPNGCPITMWSANDSLGQPPAIIAQDMLERAGFVLEHNNVDFGVFIGQVRGGTAPAFVYYNTTSVIGDDTIIRFTGEYYPGNNWSGIQDDEYDRHVAAGIAASTEQEKFEHFHAAQRRLMDLQVLFPVATFSAGRVSQSNISGYVIYGDDATRLHTVTKS